MRTPFGEPNILVKEVPPTYFNPIVRKRLTTVLLVVPYMSIIVSYMSFPTVMKLIDNDVLLRQYKKNIFPSTAEIVSMVTLFIMGGKFVFGPVTDAIGGEAMLLICMVAMGLLLATCSYAGTLNRFALSWTIISFFYASAWGAVGSVIRVGCNININFVMIIFENATLFICRLLFLPRNGLRKSGTSHLHLGWVPSCHLFSSVGSLASPLGLGALSFGWLVLFNFWYRLCMLSH